MACNSISLQLCQVLKKSPFHYQVEIFWKKTEIFVKAIQRFWCVQHVGPILKKIQQKQPKWLLSMLKKPRHVSVLNILRSNFFQIYLTPMDTFVCPSPWQISSNHRKTKIWSENLNDGNNNIFFGFKVWLFWGWAETSFNQFEQKMSKITRPGN